MRKRVMLLAPAVGAITLAVVFLFWSRGHGAAASREVAAPSSPALRWEIGAQRVYEVTTDAVVTMRFPGAAGPMTVQARVAGVLVLDVVGGEEQGVRGRLRLARASYAAAGGPDRARELRLGTPFDVSFDADGRPLRFDFPSAVPAEGRVVLEQLVRTFQVVTAQGAAGRWTAREENATGRYVADYQVGRDGTIVKRKTGYEAVAVETNGIPGPLAVRLPRSRATVRLGDCWVDAVTLDEEMEVLARGERVMASKLKASLVRVAAAPPEEDATAFGAAEETAARVVDPEAALARLLDGLAASDGTSTAAVHGIRDLVATHPETAARVVAALAEGKLGDHAAAALVNALELAGTPEAQAALGTILEGDAFGRMNRLRAAISLGAVEAPAPGAVESLWRTSDRRETPEASEIAHTSLLALGALAPRARGPGEDAVGPVEKRLTERLAAARDEDEAGILLGALGNTKNGALATTVLPYLGDASAYVRSSAADALGNMPGPEAEAGITERLEREDNPMVRTELASSLARTEKASVATLKAVQAMVLKERTDSARLAMTRLLADHLEAYPAAKPTLEKLLKTDRSARVRTCAGEALLRTGYRPS